MYDHFENKIFLGKYKAQKLLGEGSFGKIYEGNYNSFKFLIFLSHWYKHQWKIRFEICKKKNLKKNKITETNKN